jgi:hypothetical protein
MRPLRKAGSSRSLQSGQKPLYTLQALAFRELVGGNLFWFRLAGLSVTVGIGLAHYKILEIFFDRWAGRRLHRRAFTMSTFQAMEFRWRFTRIGL